MNLLAVLLAVSSGNIMDSLLILGGILVIYAIVMWALKKFPVDNELKNILHVIIVIIVAVALINVVLTLIGKPLF